ncbi:Uncharacterised protein [Chlamydia trachomatis]|nr:Uncharacterised protein [Chlamydia trachomatis]
MPSTKIFLNSSKACNEIKQASSICSYSSWSFLILNCLPFKLWNLALGNICLKYSNV